MMCAGKKQLDFECDQTRAILVGTGTKRVWWKGKKIIIIIIIIINMQDWSIWPFTSSELQLLSPTFLRSPNCSLSLWSVVI